MILHRTAVISPSMLYLLYPLDGEVPGYSRDEFVQDLVNECEKLVSDAIDVRHDERREWSPEYTEKLENAADDVRDDDELVTGVRSSLSLSREGGRSPRGGGMRRVSV